jgi:hypothetical protein
MSDDDTGGHADGEVCIANIGPRQRAMRMRFGVATLLVGVVFAGGLAWIGVAGPWRLFVVLPFWAGATGVFQAQEKT